MYPFVDNRTLSYPETIAYWKDYLKDLNMNCIKYLEIGSLHGGSLLTFHNMFGPNVESTCIDPFSNCDYYHERIMKYLKRIQYSLVYKNRCFTSRPHYDPFCVFLSNYLSLSIHFVPTKR